MKFRTTPPLLALLLLMAPLANASEIAGKITVESAVVHDAQGSMGLVSLKFLANNGTTPSGFRLDAESLRIELDQTEYSVTLGQERVDYSAATTQSQHSKTRLQGGSQGMDTRWVLESVEGSSPPLLAASTSCVRLDSSPRSLETSHPVVNRAERPDRRTPVADAIRLRPCGETSITVTGDFVLSLWDWDAQLQSDSGTHLIDTGVHPRSDGVGEQATEAYLFAKNAVLSLSIDSDPAAFFVQNASLDAATTRLSGARGDLRLDESTLPLTGDVVEIDGQVQIQFQGQGTNTPLQADLEGSATVAPLGATPLTINAPTTPGTSPVAWIVLSLALLAAPLVARHTAWPIMVGRLQYFTSGYALDVGPRTIRERIGAGWSLLAERALDKDQWSKARRYAHRANRLFPVLPNAPFILAGVANRLGEYDRAIRFFQETLRLARTRQRRAYALCGAASAQLSLGEQNRATAYRLLAQARQESAAVTAMCLRADAWKRRGADAATRPR